MKERLKQNSNGWYAVGGSFAIMFIMIATVSGSIGDRDDVMPMITYNFLPFMFSLIAAFISIASLFCGTRKQRDGIFCGLFFSHLLMFLFMIIGAMGMFGEMYYSTGMELGVLVLFIIGITMDSVYEGVGNSRDKH